MAGRIPKPWYRTSKGAWYVHVGGKTIRLGKDKNEVFRRFHLLMAGQDQTPRREKREQSLSLRSGAEALSVGELAGPYLADLERRADARTVCVARCYLKPFLAECCTRPVEALKKHHVESVIRKHGRWSGTTENHVKSRIVALFRRLGLPHAQDE